MEIPVHALEDKAFLPLTAVASLAFGWILWPLHGGMLWAVTAAIFLVMWEIFPPGESGH